MRGTLVSIDAWNRATGARQTVRIGGALNSVTMGADGYVWEPAFSRRPRLSMQLADDDLSGELMQGTGEMAINAGNLRFPLAPNTVDPMQLDWVGSPVRVYSGDSDRLSDMRLEFSGRITAGTTDPDTAIVPVTMEVDKALVDVPLLTALYGGGGGIDGDVELRGNTKPAGYGRPINVKPILINATLAIYQVDAYGNTLGFSGVYEDLASFGAPVQNFASYALLAAAVLTEGTWATCIAEGLFRLGADATGTITCDPIFGAGLPGSMMLRWLTVHAAVPAARIRTTDFDALTAAVQAAVGAAPTVSFWTADANNVLELMQRMCASCNAVPLLLLDGTIGVARCIGGAVALTLNRQGGTPAVTAWQSSDPPAPWWRLRMAAARAYYVNGASEIDYEDDIRDMGDFSATETYRQGMVVRGGDGARYIYKATTPAAGRAPPNADYWDIYEDAPDATQIRYPSGATLAEKEPATPGATAGAPVGTNVGGTIQPNGTVIGGRLAQDVVSGLEINAQGIIEQALRQDDAQRIMDLRTFVNGQQIGTFFEQFRQDQITANGVIRSDVELLGARTDEAVGSILALRSVVIENGKTVATKLDEVGASNGTVNSNVKQLMEAVIEPDGSGHAKFALTADVNGSITGVYGLATKTSTALNFVAAMFNFVDPNGGNPINMLSYDSGQWTMNATLAVKNIVADTITARMVKAGAMTNLTSSSFADQSIGASEVVIAEITNFNIGDSVDGRALIDVNFTQDGSQREDTAMLIRAYLKMPGQADYVMVRNTRQGITVGGGKAYWILPVNFSIPVLGSGLISVRISAQGYSLAGGYTTGSYARDILINIFTGTR